MSLILWVNPKDCDKPHGLDLRMPRDAHKVNALAEAFSREGFDRSRSALVGYPRDGRIQLLSGTHRHEAALRTGTTLPVVLWLRSTIESSWGDLDRWLRIMEDISVATLETWGRDEVEARAVEADDPLRFLGCVVQWEDGR